MRQTIFPFPSWRRGCLLWLLLVSAWASAEELEIYSLDPGGPEDYLQSALRLALEKTRLQYGNFVLRQSPRMSFRRAHHILSQGKYPNAVMSFPSSVKLREERGLLAVPYPLMRGLMGYRVCFASKQVADRVAAVKDLPTLRALTQGAGLEWLDTDVFRHNGIPVAPVEVTESLYKMLAARRFDLYCRSVTEVLIETEQWRSHEGIFLDEGFALFYGMPYFFHVKKDNPRLHERLGKGIDLALADGSLLRLWRQHFQSSIDFTKLDGRIVLHLAQPNAEAVGIDYGQFLYRPGEDISGPQNNITP